MSPRLKFDLSLLPEQPNISFESGLWEQGYQTVAGLDEAGRGALAGPVSAGAVVFSAGASDLCERLEGVRDSKVMTASRRDRWAIEIKAAALSWGVGFASPHEIDQIGIVSATYLAMARALAQLSCEVDHLLVDFLTLPDILVPQMPLVKGDARSLSIASAAILAKTARDALLIEMDEVYPGYGFASNKGYATQTHRSAIKKLGPCAEHRRSFSPVSDYYSLFPSVY
jgi:ribonuclease HII